MAGTTIIMSKLKHIVRLRSNGVPLQTIAKASGLSRNTVKKYLRLIEVKKLGHEDLLKMDDAVLDALLNDPEPQDDARYQSLASLFDYIEKELTRTGVNRWILWGEYRLLHPDGYSYSQFCDYYRQWKKTMAGSFHQTHQPGEKMFIDYTGKKLPIVDPQSGEVIEVEVYVAVLGYSQLTYVEAVASQKKEDFISATQNALHFFGGVPRVLIPDNLKSAVQKADKYEAEINTAFMDFANHYGTTVLPARSRKPQDKAIVEKTVSIAYSRIFAPLRNRIFYSFSSLNQAIAELLVIHNQQSFQQRAESRSELFDLQEKQALMPLAAERYEIRIFKEVTVMKNGYIQIYEDKHSYTVPYRFIGQKVKLIYSASHVYVYYKKERIAYHRRVKSYGYTTTPEHLSSTNKFVSEWNPDKFIGWAAAISPVVKEYIIQILDSASYPEQAYRSCVGILSYEKKVGTARLIKAIERATNYGAFNYTMIKRILEGGLDKIAFGEEEGSQSSLPFHENIRGPQDYQ
jgi:transposase